MSESKEERVARAAREAEERRLKALRSLAHCLGRSDVMRLHHEGLVHEMMEAPSLEAFTTVKKLRFAAYICFWFAGLATVVERYQQLSRNGTIPASVKLDALISSDFLDVLKPFRNAVAHCSSYDDERVLALLGSPEEIPDRATDIARAFREYITTHDPSAYEAND